MGILKVNREGLPPVFEVGLGRAFGCFQGGGAIMVPPIQRCTVTPPEDALLIPP